MKTRATNQTDKPDAKAVYAFIAENWDDEPWCHGMVAKINSDLAPAGAVYTECNEARWDRVSEILSRRQSPYLESEEARNLIEDIADGTTNGHSFLRVDGRFVDPYLKALGVGDVDIHVACAFLDDVFQEAGR